jgi:hypothetical protein
MSRQKKTKVGKGEKERCRGISDYDTLNVIKKKNS